jgi:hypothetical protein
MDAKSKREASNPGDPAQPAPTLVTYRVKKGKENEFVRLLAKHWPTLNQLGLVSKDRPRYWRATDKRDHEKVSFVELFTWKDGKSADVAHQTPEVMALWEPMGPMLEGLDLQAVEPLDLGH